jgi:hypothetical protein
MQHLGNRTEDSSLDFKWNTNAIAGESITRATNGTVSVYKGNNTTQSTAGVTDTEDFDSLTGVHHCRIDLSADAFYVTGEDYQVVLSAATIDGKTINAVLASFTIEKGFDEVDVVKFGGSAGTFAAGIPEVKAASIATAAQQAMVETCFTYNATADYASADAGSLVAQIADNATGGGGGGGTDWTADEKTALKTILGVPASGTTPDVPIAGALKVIDDLLDTEIATLLTNVADILADTNELQTDLADGGRLDLLIDAIKAKTDNLPADTNTFLTTIAGYIDTEIATLLTNVATILAAVAPEIADILADTNELQTDWVNGGRLDLLIDAIKAKTDTIDDIYVGHISAQFYADDEDRYAVSWSKNGVVVTAGITLPIIKVIKWSDGTVLINDEAMDELGVTQTFKYAETVADNRVGNDEVALVICKATIDAAVRAAYLWVRKPVAD